LNGWSVMGCTMMKKVSGSRSAVALTRDRVSQITDFIISSDSSTDMLTDILALSMKKFSSTDMITNSTLALISLMRTLNKSKLTHLTML
jgi:hypothetical protein